MYNCVTILRKLKDIISTSSLTKFVCRYNWSIIFNEYVPTEASGSDVELELSQVTQNTHLSKNGTRVDSTKGCC